RARGRDRAPPGGRVMSALRPLAVFAALLVAWQTLVWALALPPFILPPPRRGRSFRCGVRTRARAVRTGAALAAAAGDREPGHPDLRDRAAAGDLVRL